MARKFVHKTPLGRRLAEVRDAMEMTREEMSVSLGVASPSAIANYERGDNVPDADVLRAYRNYLGVDIGWLLIGEGEMFLERSKPPAPRVRVDPFLLQQLQRAARRVYKAAGHRVADDDIFVVEAGRLYNALLDKVTDVRDAKIVEAVLPILLEELEKRLAEADENPGTGKLSA